MTVIQKMFLSCSVMMVWVNLFAQVIGLYRRELYPWIDWHVINSSLRRGWYTFSSQMPIRWPLWFREYKKLVISMYPMYIIIGPKGSSSITNDNMVKPSLLMPWFLASHAISSNGNDYIKHIGRFRSWRRVLTIWPFIDAHTIFVICPDREV